MPGDLPMNTEKRIVIACFIGAALGAVTALQLHYFWWVGIIVGGVTGYLAYGFRDVIRAIRIAWASRDNAGEGFKAGLRGALRFLGVFACIVCCAASVLALSIGALMSLVVPAEAPATWQAPAESAAPAALPALFWLLATAGVLLPLVALSVCILRSENKATACKNALACLLATPLLLPITLVVTFAWAVIPRAGRLLYNVARHAFILIHSEVRLLCLTDSLLGALAGYACGHALVGGLIGAALGWVNYRYVSVKWLKLAKA